MSKPSMQKVGRERCAMCRLFTTVSVEFNLGGLSTDLILHFCSDCLAKALTLTGEYWSAEPVNAGATVIEKKTVLVFEGEELELK